MKNYIIGFIAVAALVVGVIGVSKQPVVKQGSQGSQGEQGVKGNDGYTPVKGVDYFDGKDGARGERGASGAIGMPGKLGAVSGPDHYFQEFFHDGLVDGGGIRATSTVNSAETLLATDLNKAKVIAYTLNVQNATLTLPATSTLSSFIQLAGESRTIFIRNASTTAKTLTIAGGTGMNLLVASTTNAMPGNTSGSNSARLEFTRRADKDIDVTMDIYLK